MFDKFIEDNSQSMIDSLSCLIKFPSVSIESNNIDSPFGIECNNALNYILNLADSMGFKTKNLDNYCGYIEFGEGEEIVGIIGHLDVVPADISDGWTTPPFEPTIRDGKLFGRGSIDDKGPVIASLYAMKAIKNSKKISKRIRLILGLNEEKSWKCINYYKKLETWPNIGFSPDANFPGIYAEKGIISMQIKFPFGISNFKILDITCNNNALNVVPKYCAITLKSNNISNNFINTLSAPQNIKITLVSENTFKIESFGVSSHAAHPELGENAITNLISFLIDNFNFSSDSLRLLKENGFFSITSPKFLNTENTIEDESGILTSNVAFIQYENENLLLKTNLRVPVNTSLNYIQKKYSELKTILPEIETSKISSQNPLFVEKNSYLVKTLVDIFNKKTGLNEMPIAIGGGTYARAFENCISYGATMPGEKDMCHQVDEFIKIDSLILSAKIYANAIYELAK